MTYSPVSSCPVMSGWVGWSYVTWPYVRLGGVQYCKLKRPGAVCDAGGGWNGELQQVVDAAFLGMEGQDKEQEKRAGKHGE